MHAIPLGLRVRPLLGLSRSPFVQAAAFGMVECIQNDLTREGGYSVRPGAKLFWLLFWTVEEGWVCVFAPLCAWAMCGERQAVQGLLSGSCTRQDANIAGTLAFMAEWPLMPFSLSGARACPRG